MQPWAKRIHDRLIAGKKFGLTQTGLAKACRRSQPSINQWFNATDKKPATEMIMGDNLVAAANYLSVSPQWIITGKDRPSQSVQLDADMIRAAIILAKRSLKLGAGEELLIERDPETFAQALRTAIAQIERLEAEHGIRLGSGDGKTGSIGGTASTPKAGATARPEVGGATKRSKVGGSRGN